MGRCAVDPLASLSRAPENDDPKRPRRELTTDEIERLLAAAEAGPKLVRVTGADRAMLYRLLLGTGLRFSEAMSLTPESFELDHATGPRVRVLPAFSKNRKPVFQPMPTDLAGAPPPLARVQEARQAALADAAQRLPGVAAEGPRSRRRRVSGRPR
jgi:integrase